MIQSEHSEETEASNTWLPEFRERAPWLGGDLQTLRMKVLEPLVKGHRAVVPRSSQNIILPLDDGSEDSLVGVLECPLNLSRKPLVILIHGLTGTAESAYNLVAASYLLMHNYPVLRLNLRGAGASRVSCRSHYHAGSSHDLVMALRALRRISSVRPLLNNGVLLVGFSLGGSMMLKLLGEAGEKLNEQCQVFIRGAASISAPIDLAAASKRIHEPRNLVYHRYLLERMKKEAIETPGGLPPWALLVVENVKTIYDFDDQYTAPNNGFKNTSDYYAQTNALQFLKSISTATLLIYALNDPWIPAEAYRQFNWAESQYLIPGLTPGGGHVGFHDAADGAPWHNRALVRFFDRILGES